MAEDLPVFFTHQIDNEAVRMAAFTAKDPADRAAFMAHWKKILATPEIIVRTIVLGNSVAGHVMSYVEEGKPEVTYWLGREYWGRGIATRALSEFLRQVQLDRPIYARAARDNIASIRVLTHCGFALEGTGWGYANARGKEIEECLFQLGGSPPFRTGIENNIE
jgi:RimJ/RimL family protein N-acetyltransferase